MVSAEQGKTSRPAEVVLPCDDLDATVSFFVDELGFRVDGVYPADDPRVIEISGHELHLRLERGPGDPGVLRVVRDDVEAEEERIAPNGTRVRFVPTDPPLDLPDLEPSLVVTRMGDGAGWHTGRAGMDYRDLIPGRQGGWIIASHIRIPVGGRVPDYVHYHRIRFQMIYCLAGWVRVVYEDQGAPFVLEAGDCVLQPPRIRHRVLECSPGLEVIEVSCPADHETRADHELHLPNIGRRTGRGFDGQRFLRHVASEAEWAPWRADGFRARDTGMAGATRGLAGARVVRPERQGAASKPVSHGRDLLFLYVIRGAFQLRVEGGEAEALEAGDAAVVPGEVPHALAGCSTDLEFLEVLFPADGGRGPQT